MPDSPSLKPLDADLSQTRNPLRFVTAASLFDGHDAAINVMRRLIQAQGAEPEAMTQARFAQLLKSDYAKWKGIVEASGAKLD